MKQTVLRLFDADGLRSLLRVALGLVLSVVLALVLSRVDRDTRLTLEDTRPPLTVVTMGLSALALAGLLMAVRAFAAAPRRLAWKMSLRLVGWYGLAAALLGFAVFYLSTTELMPEADSPQAVGAIIPLVAGIHAAFVFSPEDEPPLEVLASCPRSLSWLLAERIAVLLALYAGVGLLTMFLAMMDRGDRDLPIALARWLPPTLFFVGLSTYTTLSFRVPALSAAVIALLWFAFGFMGAALLPGAIFLWPLSLLQPFLWPLHVYLQPGLLPLDDYWLNRLFIAASGFALLWLTLRRMRDEEKLLFAARSRHQSKG